MGKRSIAVRIGGQEYRIRSDAEEDWLQRVAGCVDVTMAQIRERTGAVDTLDVAMLTCLNLAREVLALRERRNVAQTGAVIGGERLRELIERVEAAVGHGEALQPGAEHGAGGDRTPPDDATLLGSLEIAVDGSADPCGAARASRTRDATRKGPLAEAGGTGS